MYSVVLLMAITTGGESADGCRGCRGCGCGCYCGCYSGCRGCRKHCGCGCYGCYSCYSCYRGCGCYSYGGGCYGGCVSYGCGGYAGCVSYGCAASAPVCAGCAAGTVVGSVTVGGNVVVSNYVPINSTVVRTVEKPLSNTTATIVVNVPDTAKVTIDGNPTASTSATRYFESPTLAPGHTYSYTLEAEYQKDGAPVKVAKKVKFQAGSLVRCDLTSADAAVVSSK